MLKTHNCGELNREHIGQEVQLAGWVDRRRDHGGLIFIDLRDREGVVQVVFNPELSKASHDIASEMRSEYVITLKGEVAPRPAGTENPRLPTGEVEIIVKDTKILGTAKTPPFYINEEVEVEESLRLKYRYLDLRRPRMQKNVILRHRVVKFIRDFLDSKGFLEIETPILIKSTPEGARDYLVPSRLYAGKFYALPQSPQQLKQLLMVAGLEKYFQIAKCFRDEDTRADRQPEFTQLDMEMSFVDVNDVMDITEEMLVSMIKTVQPAMRLTTPFPRITYAEAMERYGSDKPDVRYGLPLVDLSDIAGQTAFAVFRTALEAGGKVKGICAPGCGGYSRGQLDELNRFAQNLGAKGVLTISLTGTPGNLDSLTMDNVKSVAARFLTIEQVREIARRLEAKAGDLLLILAGKAKQVNAVLGELRQEMARRLKLIEPNTMAPAFIVDFPLVERGETPGEWVPVRHPFTLPMEEDVSFLETDPEKVRSCSYDIVSNGYELGGGSLRIYTSELQRKVFHARGYSDAEIEELFGHMLEAFDFGAPPHGGIAFGVDRIVMLLAGEPTIREVIAFPKNQNAVDLTLNAPSPVTETQLADLHLRVRED